jgi:1-acyl-sn-glycerol-3-phosphate acyltransferase
MYLVTHIIVFTLSPLWFVRTFLSPESVHTLKERFGKLLLVIVNKRVTVLGLDNVEEGKHYLIVANYPSFHTGFMLMMLFPEASIIAHAFMSKVPILGNMLKRNGIIYAHRTGFRKTKHAISVMIERGDSSSIIILPEGKRTPDGLIQEFKRGFIYILRRSSLDLLPVTLSGFYRLKPLNRPYMDPDTELEVIIHKPISQSTIRALNDEQLLTATLSSIEGSYKP